MDLLKFKEIGPPSVVDEMLINSHSVTLQSADSISKRIVSRYPEGGQEQFENFMNIMTRTIPQS
jgi:hypothetical protein